MKKTEKKELPLQEKKKVRKEEKKVLKKVLTEEKKEEKKEEVKREISCKEAQESLIEFLDYLNEKSYVRRYCREDIKERISSVLKKLSENPPIPSGEKNEDKFIIRNIFHFFRVLSKSDIRLIKEIMENESDQIEYLLRWYYVWLRKRKECPDRYGLLVSEDTAYRYASFFINTIGGRAYLSRRKNIIRLLASYYSVCIIYDMDKEGKNTFGIDYCSYITELKDEIKRFPELNFQKLYLENLEKIEEFCKKKT